MHMTICPLWTPLSWAHCGLHTWLPQTTTPHPLSCSQLQALVSNHNLSLYLHWMSFYLLLDLFWFLLCIFGFWLVQVFLLIGLFSCLFVFFYLGSLPWCFGFLNLHVYPAPNCFLSMLLTWAHTAADIVTPAPSASTAWWKESTQANVPHTVSHMPVCHICHNPIHDMSGLT